MFSCDCIYTDNEIPVEELLEGIKVGLNEHKSTFCELMYHNKVPTLIVIGKADYDRILTAHSTGLF